MSRAFQPDRLRQALDASGMTQARLAILARVPLHRVRDWLSGHATPGSWDLLHMQAVFGHGVDFFLTPVPPFDRERLFACSHEQEDAR